MANHPINATRLNPDFDLGRTDVWIFDIDNTLYPASCDLFSQIHVNMARFVAAKLGVSFEQAKDIRRALFLKYGTTLRGLMDEHGADPDAYLAMVHNVDYAPIQADAALRRILENLPGRKLVFTNASTDHGKKCAERLGVADLFDGWFDIRDANFRPKPDMDSYHRFAQRFDVDPARAIFFEDTLNNLAPAKALGWQTAYIDPAIGVGAFENDPKFANLDYVDAHGAGLHAFFDAHWQKDN